MLITVAAMLLSGTAADCMAQENGSLKVKVTGIRSDKGRIMVAAGDYNHPETMAYGMTQAKLGSVECILHDKFEPESNIYAFHDENGNFNLDKDTEGKPVESCFAGITEADDNGVITIPLTDPEAEKPENE